MNAGSNMRSSSICACVSFRQEGQRAAGQAEFDPPAIQGRRALDHKISIRDAVREPRGRIRRDEELLTLIGRDGQEGPVLLRRQPRRRPSR